MTPAADDEAPASLPWRGPWPSRPWGAAASAAAGRGWASSCWSRGGCWGAGAAAVVAPPPPPQQQQQQQLPLRWRSRKISDRAGRKAAAARGLKKSGEGGREEREQGYCPLCRLRRRAPSSSALLVPAAAASAATRTRTTAGAPPGQRGASPCPRSLLLLLLRRRRHHMLFLLPCR